MRPEIRHRFIEGLQYVRSHQLLTGDIPCFRAAPDRFYCPCPVFSTLVDDALGYFDPHSPIYQPGILDSVSAAECRWIMGCATTVRWRIRSFIAWQEEPDGTWQFFGRESTSGADAATTACAAAVLLRAPRLAIVRSIVTRTSAAALRQWTYDTRNSAACTLSRSHRPGCFAFDRGLSGRNRKCGSRLFHPGSACRDARLAPGGIAGTDRFASTLRGRLLAFHAENRGAGSALDFGLAAGALVDAGCSVQVARNVLE